MRELSLHILDLMENSIEAGAHHLQLTIVESTDENRLGIFVQDDGRGMDERTIARAIDPFYTTRQTRQVGLGIALFKAAAERCNGKLLITSTPGVGTTVAVEFQYDHLDRAPLGDIKSSIMSVILAQQSVDLRYIHQVDDRRMEFNSEEIKAILGDVPITEPRVTRWLDDYLQQEYDSLYSSNRE